MKNIKILLIILTATLFLAACSKDEETFTSITGQLNPGENVTADELIGVDLALCQYRTDDDINSSYDIIDMTVLDELGEFEFTNMSPGNYFIGMNEFIFTTDTVYRFRFDGTEALNIKQTIIRNPAENYITPYPPCVYFEARIDMTNYSGPELTQIIAHGYIYETGELAEKSKDFEVIDGDITLKCYGLMAPYCINPGYNFIEEQFIFGFADGNGGTVYSEKFEFNIDGDNCEGLPQTIGQTTISYEWTASQQVGYKLTNN